MEAIGRLAGGVAHDFNNLLTVILSYSEMLLRRLESGSPMHEDITLIREAGESAASLTQQLLTFSRKQARKPVTLDLVQLVQGMERMLGRLIGEDVTLVTRLEADLWPVTVDPGHMEQVIVNLVVNARDAMPRGGQLSITTRNVEQHLDEAIAEPDIEPGRYAQLIIEDTGSGMDASTLARLFEPFFTTKNVGKGTGLGLATVYGIVRQSEGHIRVTSHVGVGTRFVIWLPATAQPIVPALAPVTLDDDDGGGQAILIVEDDAGIRRLARRTLEEAGFVVLDACDGLEALALYRASAVRIDLVLTDVVMPRMGGFELARRLKLEQPHLQILYMTGYMGGVEVDSTPHGLVDVLAKPFNSTELVKAVRRALGSSAIAT
jgi:two-component system, cell cycle sensor histidine kinase and response regulator CckA